MIRSEFSNGVITLQFESLVGLPVEVHVATRHGGVSPAPWNSLNFSSRRGDAPERVAANRSRLAESLELDSSAIVFCGQVHGTGIAKVDWGSSGQLQEGSDGSVTDAQRLPLGLVFADCVPVVLYDRVHHALGVVHAGWRGTVNGAAAACLWAMRAAYDTRPKDVLAGIGPSIGPESYEVGQEVHEMAMARLANASAFFSYPNGDGRNPHFDLWQANAEQLVAEGVPAGQIEVSGIDTATHTHDFFSHRAEQGRCGLFTMVAWLRDPA